MLTASQRKNQPIDQIERLWSDLAHDPAQQALACAALCRDSPPQLAAWLKAKILADLPDTLFKQLVFAEPLDGRIEALNILAEVHAPPRPQATPKTIPSSKTAKRGEQGNQQLSLCGIPIRVIADNADRQLRSDPELGRLAIALWLAHQYRLWIVARELDRQSGGPGCVTKSQLKKKLKFYGITYTDRQLRRLFALGEGIFWRQDRKHRDRLYLISWQNAGLNLVTQAQAQGIEIGFNRPGTPQQLVEVSGSLQAWQARLYAAWIGYRAGEEGLSIARNTQARLFNRSPKTIRQWERHYLQGIVTKRYDYEQHPDEVRSQNALYDLQPHIPAHAQPYSTFTNQGRVQRRYWQRPNTYTSAIQSHRHRGQARKVRQKVNAGVSADQPTADPQRQNYTLATHRKRVKSQRFRQGLDGDVMAPVHVYLGEYQGRGIWELMVPDPGAPDPVTTRQDRELR